MLTQALIFLKWFRNTLGILSGKLGWYSPVMSWQHIFFWISKNFICLCQFRPAWSGTDKACEDGEVSSSQLLFYCSAASGWPPAGSHLPGPVRWLFQVECKYLLQDRIHIKVKLKRMHNSLRCKFCAFYKLQTYFWKFGDKLSCRFWIVISLYLVIP